MKEIVPHSMFTYLEQNHSKKQFLNIDLHLCGHLLENLFFFIFHFILQTILFCFFAFYFTVLYFIFYLFSLFLFYVKSRSLILYFFLSFQVLKYIKFSLTIAIDS